jgi:hypothetical protein
MALANDRIPQDERGRFVPSLCPDPHCGGFLCFVPDDTSPRWECCGLTHERFDGPLVACGRVVDAPRAFASLRLLASDKRQGQT